MINTLRQPSTKKRNAKTEQKYSTVGDGTENVSTSHIAKVKILIEMIGLDEASEFR